MHPGDKRGDRGAWRVAPSTHVRLRHPMVDAKSSSTTLRRCVGVYCSLRCRCGGCCCCSFCVFTGFRSSAFHLFLKFVFPITRTHRHVAGPRTKAERARGGRIGGGGRRREERERGVETAGSGRGGSGGHGRPPWNSACVGVQTWCKVQGTCKRLRSRGTACEFTQKASQPLRRHPQQQQRPLRGTRLSNRVCPHAHRSSTQTRSRLAATVTRLPQRQAGERG